MPDTCCLRQVLHHPVDFPYAQHCKQVNKNSRNAVQYIGVACLVLLCSLAARTDVRSKHSMQHACKLRVAKQLVRAIKSMYWSGC